uniref:SCP domain-containing protein n=1 Tax=Haemonchus contortus TaxID=6289 RepID=A0A7I5E758_HAECO
MCGAKHSTGLPLGMAQFVILQPIMIMLCILEDVSSQQCPENSEMTVDLRNSFLNRHNTLRSSLAQGLQQNDNLGLAPPATNMERMEYSCEVETSAIRSAETCSGGASLESLRPDLEENTFKVIDMTLDLDNVAETAMTNWWGQLARNGVDEPNMKLTPRLRYRLNSIVDFSKMAWHNTVKLGCAIQRCPTFYFVVCQYGPRGNIINENIYDVGSTCSKCPTGSVCDRTSGLCVSSSAINTGTSPTTIIGGNSLQNLCPGNTGMTDTLRNAYLNKHNELRSSIARGTGAQRNGPIGPAPPASNMEEMVYDCAVEASAIRHAQTCDGELSSEGSRPGLKENIQKIDDLSLDYSAAAEQAMTIWWSELARSGIRSDMLFDYPTRHRTTNIVTHWSKMAWHDNVRLGCAIQRCKSFYFAVCQYGPGGNVVGDYIYNVAAVCSTCPFGTFCNATTALCVRRLQ